MTIEEFNDKFKRNTRFDKYWYTGLCYLTISFGLFMTFALLTKSFVRFSGSLAGHLSIYLFLILLGIYGLFVLKTKYKLTIWENGLTKEQNIGLLKYAAEALTKSNVTKVDNYAHFVYKKSWWRLPYEVHLFADNNLIAISAESQDYYDGGFIDFGASKRTQKKILKLLIEQASR